MDGSQDRDTMVSQANLTGIGGVPSDPDGPTATWQRAGVAPSPRGGVVNLDPKWERPVQRPMQHQKLRDSQQRKYG